MAGETIVIVARVVAHQIAVRVMASRATYPPVISEETFAVGQPIGLKSHVHLAPCLHAHHRIPSAMAGATEIRQVFSRHLTQLLGRSGLLALLQRLLVRVSALVAMLAIQARLHGIEGQLSLAHGA